MELPYPRSLIWFWIASAVLGLSSASRADWLLLDIGGQGGVYAWRYLPSAPAEDPLPVVIFFHGSGSSPEAWMPILAPVAEASGVAVILPRSEEFLTFLPGADDITIEEALRRVGEEVTLDRRRISLAGHSAGGGHAAVLAYGRATGIGRTRINAVFLLGSPYRTVLDVADPDRKAPIRMYYGTLDPNYTASRVALVEQWKRLGIPWELDVASGYGHGNWPAQTLEDGFRFLGEHPYETAGGCIPDATTLCLRDGEFEVSATWTDAAGASGTARVASARSAESGLLTFFSDSNWELQVKVLDGCALNQRYWVFAAGTTDVGFELEAKRRPAGNGEGETVTYVHGAGTPAQPILDTAAFVCD